MVNINPTIPIIRVTISGLKAPNKRQGLSEWITQDPTICCLQETNFKYKDTYRLKATSTEKDIPS